MEASIPKPEQSKALVTFAIAIAIIILIIVFAKNIKSLFKQVGTGLGLTSSEEKENVNEAFFDTKANSPLSSSTFDKMQKVAPVGSPLLTVSVVHALIQKLLSYRGIFTDDDEKVVGLFTGGFNTQFQVAWFAKRFYIETGSDLFDWMRKNDALFSQGLAASTVNKVLIAVSRKPKWNL